MRRAIAALAVTVTQLTAVAPASSGPYEDAMLKCMVSHTAPADNDTLILWITVAFASTKAAQGHILLMPSEVEKAQRQMGAYANRIFLTDCVGEVRDAVKYEGQMSVINTFSQLTRIAGRQAMSDPAASKVMDGYYQYLNGPKIEALLGGQN